MRTFRGDRKSVIVSNGGVPVTSGATSFTVAAGAATDFPGPGSATFLVQATGESIIIGAGLGTTSWSSITRGANHTTAAAIPDGSVLEEITGANDFANFQQKDDTGLGSGLLATTTPIVDGIGAVGTSNKAARADHVHPASGSGAADATTSSVGVVEVDHSPSGPHPIAMTLDGTAIPSGMLSSATPAADGAGTGGTAVTASRSDHQHPLVTNFGSSEVTVPDLKVTGLTGSVQASRYVGATSSGAPTTGAHLVGDASLSLSDGKWYVCTVAGTPGTFVTPSGSGGSVTSVAVTAPSDTTVTGSPVTTSGTIAITDNTQSANTVKAGPTTGSAATPGYRALVAADVPAVNPSALTGSGTVPAAALPQATTSAFGAVKPDGTSIAVAGGVISTAAAANNAGSYSGNATPSTSDSVSLIDRLRGGSLGSTFYSALQHEFDLQYYNGVYYLARPNVGDTATQLVHASSVTGLGSASVDTTIATQYPSLLFDGTTWHVWGWNGSNDIHHWTASSFGGTYTHVDSVGLNVFDPQVRRNPVDGMYYMAYCSNTAPTGLTGIARAASPAGPWTDLGLIFSAAGNPSIALQQFDPTPIFWNGRAYMGMSATPTNPSASNASCLLVELDPSNSYKVVGAPVLLPTGNGGYNPIFLARPDEPGQEQLYVLTLDGTRSLQVGPTPADGRRTQSGLRLNTATGADVATGFAATLHGGGAWGPNGLSCPSAPSGAYGRFGLNGLADFTVTVEFSISTMPSADALLVRISPYTMGTNEIAVWITSSGLLKAQVIASGTLTLNGVTTLTTGNIYRVALIRTGSTVSLLLNGGQEAGGTQGAALSGLTEWSVANDKGSTQAAAEQLLCSIYRTSVIGEALQPVLDALQGLPAGSAAGGYTLPVATTSILGGVKPDGTSITASGGGVLSVAGGSTVGQLLVQDGVTNPPVALYSEDGSDFLYSG